MNPFFISAILRNYLKHKRTCPACKKVNNVSLEKKSKPVKCKFCGDRIPAQSND